MDKGIQNINKKVDKKMNKKRKSALLKIDKNKSEI